MKDVIESILANIENITEKNRVKYQDRLNMIEKAYKEENEMLSPKIDSKGRFHAPCNGYRIPDVILNHCDFTASYDDTLFAKGSYLPTPIDLDSFYFQNKKIDFKYKNRILLKGRDTIDLFKTIDSKNKPFKCFTGAEWEKYGEVHAYLHIHSMWKSVVDAFVNPISMHSEMQANKEKQLREEAKQKALAEKGDAPDGKKIVVKARVETLPIYNNPYCYDGDPILKMKVVILETKATAFGSLPVGLEDVKIGDTIEFMANFKPDQKDKTHAKFTYPKNAKILETETH